MRHLPLLSILFFSVLAIEIAADTYGYNSIGYVLKPLLMPILMLLFWLNGAKYSIKEKALFTAALTFSLAGDILLMFRTKELFVFGLGAFLVAHLCYITFFWGDIKKAKPGINSLLLGLLPFVIFVGGFLSVLYPNLMAKPEAQSLVAPITAYACILGTMGLFALLRRKAVTPTGFQLVFLGALIFITSDSCIALNTFVSPIPQPTLLIMATYGIAQYMITLGVLKSRE